MYCPRCHNHFDAPLTRCPEDGEELVREPGLPATEQLAAEDELRPGSRVGEYTIEQIIGRGGMGVVYRASNPAIGSTVAIKVLSREQGFKPQALERFGREARLANRVSHPDVVKVFSFGALQSGEPYFVMELLEGVALAELLLRWTSAPDPRHHWPSCRWIIALLRRVAGVCDVMHGQGIVHRDLKPANIFIVRPDLERGDDGPRVKVLDFGVAKLTAPSDDARDALQLTAAGQALGTPSYMAFEQCIGAPVDHRVDLHALGVLAYVLLVGQRPFAGSRVEDVMAAQRAGAPRPSTLEPSLPAAVDKVLLRALHLDAARRFSSAGELVDALERGLGDTVGGAATGAAVPEDAVSTADVLAPRVAADAAPTASAVAVAAPSSRAARHRRAAALMLGLAAVLALAVGVAVGLGTSGGVDSGGLSGSGSSGSGSSRVGSSRGGAPPPRVLDAAATKVPAATTSRTPDAASAASPDVSTAPGQPTTSAAQRDAGTADVAKAARSVRQPGARGDRRRRLRRLRRRSRRPTQARPKRGRSTPRRGAAKRDAGAYRRYLPLPL